jgi:DNA-binding response OmpR family regulator
MPAKVLQIGDLEIHPGSRLVLQAREHEEKQEVELTGAEFDCFCCWCGLRAK